MARPSTPILSRALITSTALRLVDRDGAEAVSMRRLADELKVRPSSLYNHVANRLDLIEEIRALVASRIDSSMFDTEPWPQALDAWARSYRAAFARHPRTIPLLMSTSLRSEPILELYEHFTRAALRAGWREVDVPRILTALESFVLGSVLDMSGPALLFDPAGREADFPAFTAALGAVVTEAPDDPVAGPAFDWGLAALIAALAAPPTDLR